MAFQPRLKPDGTPCCFRRTDDGCMAFPRTKPCPPCTDYFNEIGGRLEARRAAELRTVQENNMTNYPVPDPYAAEIAEIRAARATPMSRFEERHAAERTADFARQHREFESFRAAQEPTPRTTAAELARFAAPDPYGPALRALREAR